MHINSSKEKVYNALTKADELSKWYTTIVNGEFKLNEITAYLKNLGANHSGKKIKARLCDFRPSFLGGYKGTPEVMISIWEN